jgi:hypothetical protein
MTKAAELFCGLCNFKTLKANRSGCPYPVQEGIDLCLQVA